MRGIRFPGRYIQGPGLLTNLGDFVSEIGGPALIVADPFAIGLLKAKLVQSFDSASIQFLIGDHNGHCTRGEVDKLAKAGRDFGAAIVVGVGGGKSLDTAKSVAFALNVPVLVCPTIAASDAPCSALSVIYGDDGRVDYDQFLPNNPNVVLVDTKVIAEAPSRYLASGIGDALATYFEADSCRRSGAHNCMNMQGVDLAFAIAETCLNVIRAHGAEALKECDRNEAGSSLEKVVEANILMSGIGFESGGVATAHAIHHGLCELDDVHAVLHGEKVAIGVLAGLLIQKRLDEFSQISDFCQSVRLPTRLSDIGITEPDISKLETVARRACRPGEIIHNEPQPVKEEDVVSALKALI